MSSQYRTCHNCGALLALGQTYCPRCKTQYIEPTIAQQPEGLEPSPPEQVVAAGPYAAQQSTVPPYSQPQGQDYTSPSVPSPYYTDDYASQAPMPPEPEQEASSFQSTTSQSGIGPGLFIIFVVVGLLLLVSISSLFYHAGQQSIPRPGATPAPVITPTSAPAQGPTPAPTHAPTPTPAPTHAPTPTPVPTQAPTPTLIPTPTVPVTSQTPTAGITVNQLSNQNATSISFPKTDAEVMYG